MRTSITTGFIIYFHFRFFVDIIEVLIPLHYISLTEIYLMICNEGIWILLSLEENRNIIFFFCRILGLLLVSHPSGRGCKTFHKWYRFWFEGMIESLTATALFSSYISSSYCGLGAVTVRNEERKDDVTAPIPFQPFPLRSFLTPFQLLPSLWCEREWSDTERPVNGMDEGSWECRVSRGTSQLRQ